MKKDQTKRVINSDRAKRICERMVNKYKSTFAIVKEKTSLDSFNYFIMSEDIYNLGWREVCEDKKLKFTKLWKMQKYYDYEVIEEDIKKAAERRKERESIRKQ